MIFVTVCYGSVVCMFKSLGNTMPRKNELKKTDKVGGETHEDKEETFEKEL